MIVLLIALFAPATAADPAPEPTAHEEAAVPLTPFDEMKAAFAERDMARFEAAWHPKGWSTNLVGSSGLSGQGMAGQIKREGWMLRPDESTLAKHTAADVYVVRCDVVKDDKAIDSVYAALGQHEGKWVVVGAGENLEEVNALAERLAEGKPLAPE